MRVPSGFWLRLAIAFAAFGQGLVCAQKTDIEASSATLVLDVPVFSGGYGISFYEETARLFERERPGVTVKLYGDPRIEDKLRVRIIDGNLPDAALAGLILWPTLIQAGKVMDLTPYLEARNWEGDARWMDTFQPGALDGWRVQGRVYGVPLTYACWTLFYNKGLFRQQGWTEPRTWDDFFVLCEKIRAAGVAPLALPGKSWRYADAFLRSAYYNLAGAEGWRRLNALEAGAWLDPRYQRAVGLMQRIGREHTLAGWDAETHTGVQQALFKGRAAMTVSGTWFLTESRGKMPDGFELGTMNIPIFPDGVSDPTLIQTGADHFFVFATGDERRVRATVDFLRFLTSRQRALDFVRQADAPVAIKGVPAAAYSPLLQPTARLIEQAKEAFNMPQSFLMPPAIRQTSADTQEPLLKGQITPRQFGERFEAAAERDRRRLADPDHVESRHPVLGTLLLLSIAAGLLWLARGKLRFRRRSASAESLRRRALEARATFFGNLRWPLAAGFVAPAFALYAALMLVPGLTSFGWSFARWDGLSERSWAGLFNFRWLLLESDVFWMALKNNLFLVVVPTIVVIPLALGLAYLLHRGIWGTKVFRAVFLFPNLLGGIAATLLWMSAYQPHGGLANAALVGLGNLLSIDALQSFSGYGWLSTANLYTSLIPIYIWMACGFNLVLYLAAMEGIDPQLYEAAQIDGASGLRQFFSVTLPMIWEVVAISAVFIVIGGLNAFEMIWLLTGQQPSGATHTLGTMLVTSMFQEFQIGRATAIAVILFVLVLVSSAVVLRGFKREVVE